jgi:hypothetical protein
MLNGNLHTIRKLVEKSTPIGELHRLEGAHYNIEEKLDNIQRFLPRNIPKRGLFNIGVTALKYLFGLATQIDLNTLHNTV